MTTNQPTNQPIFYVVENLVITEIKAQDFYDRFAKETTTPLGIGRSDYIEPAIYFSVDGEVFDSKNSAEFTFDSLVEDGKKPVMIEIQVWECKTWGYMGGFPKVCKWVETEDEAKRWLDECARFDFEQDNGTPAYFDSRAEAEEFVADFSED